MVEDMGNLFSGLPFSKNHPLVTPAKAGVQLLRSEKQSRSGFRLSPE
jgi:hypothetical protein